MRKRYIWFDLGYTLVYNDREQLYEAFLRKRGIERSLQDIERAYHKTDKLFMREYGGVLGKEMPTFFPWYLGVLNHQLGLTFYLQEQTEVMSALKREILIEWKPYPFAEGVLQQLKQLGYGVGLISNWDNTAKKVLEHCNLIDYFDYMVISSEVGVEKPDPRIFEIAMNVSSAKPEDCYYIGDNYYDDVVGSRLAGMQSLLINRYGSYGIEELPRDNVIDSVLDVISIVTGDRLQKQA